MSVAQLVETTKNLSSVELDSLIEMLQEEKLRHLEAEFAERLGTGTVFFNEPIILPEGTPALRQMLEANES